MKNIQLLDCTLRDGGACLEEISQASEHEKGMTLESIKYITKNLSLSNIDIIELGTIRDSVEGQKGFCVYPNVESISKTIPKNKNQMYAAIIRAPFPDIASIPEWNESLCEILRVAIIYSDLPGSLEFCREIVKKGYKLFIQVAVTMRYTDKELNYIMREANSMKAYAVYFVDTYGYMQYFDIKRLWEKYDLMLDSDIHIGFHSHNNMNLAYANVLEFLSVETVRNVIIDSCITGMGQGAGNLQTELIVPFLNEKYGKQYEFAAVLDVCEEIEKYNNIGKWGYSVVQAIPAIYHVSYKYSLALRNLYGFHYSEICKILQNIPDEIRYRYTPDNMKKLLETTGYTELKRREIV